MRPLIVVTSLADPDHVALKPCGSEEEAAEIVKGGTRTWACPCGQTFEASFVRSSFSTEYNARCLLVVKPIVVERIATGR